jgi:hypothetical protein
MLTDVLHLKAGLQMCCTSKQAYRCAAPQSRLTDVLHLKAGLQMCSTSKQVYRCAAPQSWPTNVLLLQMCCTSNQAYECAGLHTVCASPQSKLTDVLHIRPGLKVHKIEIFFGFDFEICIISLLVMSKY